MNEFPEWLRDGILAAETNAAENAKIAPNSYGAGYDRGYADALIAAKQEFATWQHDRFAPKFLP